MGSSSSTPTKGAKSPSSDADKRAALTIAITSGKGGVGKTNVTTNLGIALAKTGKRVCVFDADTSLANINILLNLNPEYTLEHFLRDNLAIEDIMLTGPDGLQIVPAATGIADFILLNHEQQTKLIDALEQLEQQFDYILIDTAAGISDSVLQFIQSAQYAVVVISPEPTSLTDAFSLIKVLKRQGHEQPTYVLVNMTENYSHSMEVYRRFAHAVNKYIHTKVRYLGYIPTDKAVQQAILEQSPVAIAAPDSPAGRCINLLANILLKHFTGGKAPVRKISDFWRAQLQSDDTDLPKTAEVNEDIKPQSEYKTEPTVTSEALRLDDRMSQQEAETLLADLIQYYLGEFGTLPAQAIDLILQAYAQEQLSDESMATLQRQISGDEDVAADAEIEPPAPLVKQIESQIDNLVADAEQTKRELAELATHLKQKYRELYNRDIGSPATSIRSLTERKTGKNKFDNQRDRSSLLQSSLYAAAVDRKSDK